MDENVKNYKCPACSGPLRYDGKSDRMVCDYCDSVFGVAYIEALYQNPEEGRKEPTKENVPDHWDMESSEGFTERDGIKAYNCPSCGAELLCDETTAALSCPYCDNPTIIPAALSGALKPDLILPFKLDKAAAKAALLKHFKGKKLLPKMFSEENHIDEIKGIYVPYWLFDVEARGEAEYSGNKVRTYSDRDYTYTETRVYELERCGRVAFDNIPADASEKLSDQLMESLEPFDMSQAVDFKTAYLTGFFADKYDVPTEACKQRVNDRVRETVLDMLHDTTSSYVAVTEKRSRVRIGNGKAKYVLLPVWLLNTTWHGEKYTFAMNGQTGKFVGNLPIDKSLRWKWQLIYTGGIAAVLALVEYFVLFM